MMGNISDRLWNKAGKYRIPLTGAFELLPLCNLHCKMCYVRKDMREVQKAGGIKLGKYWLNIAKEAREEGLLYPLLTGGEPLLHPDFQEIMAGMLEMGMQPSINSNGSLIDREMAKWLGKYRPVKINITLYGASEKSYERLCGDGDAFRRVHQAVEWLRQYEVPVKFNTSITPENVQDMDEMVAYAHKMQSPIQVATYMFPPIRRDESQIGMNHRLSPKDAGHAKVRADYLQNEPEWFIGQAMRYNRFVPITEKLLEQMAESRNSEMRCRAGRCSFWLDWKGNIANCGMYSSVCLPIQGLSFADAWQKVCEETDQIRYSSVCNVCPNVRICHPCIAMTYNETGDRNGWPRYLCQMNEAAANYYGEYLLKYYPDEAEKIKDQKIQSDKE